MIIIITTMMGHLFIIRIRIMIVMGGGILLLTIEIPLLSLELLF